MNFKWLSFLIDIPSFVAWLQTTFPNFNGLICQQKSFMIVTTDGHFTDANATTVKNYLTALASGTEATKRAMPSRQRNSSNVSAQPTFENAVKAHLATLDWSSMTAAQRKFAMGGVLTDTEYDTLTTS
jgi:hypothetical protein